MRAVYLKDFNINEKEVFIDGDNAHHLIKVVRIKPNESILILNGKGSKCYCQIVDLQKKSLTLQVEKVETLEQDAWLDLGLSLPKKDALEEILKKMTEIGIANFIPVKSEYSQSDFNYSARHEKIIESALIQSNNLYFPIIDRQASFTELLDKCSDYDHVFYFSSISGTDSVKKIEKGKKALMLIGPEGGFSSDEELRLAELKNSSTIKLECPIMRAPTAVCVASGYLMAQRD